MSGTSLDDAEVCVLGGTGSLGRRLVARVLSGECGEPRSVRIVSRDEAKQHQMRLALLRPPSSTEEIIYRESTKRLRFTIGDVRRFDDMRRAVDRSDVIFHAAAYKQVPTCEYHIDAAVETNVHGALNLVRALRDAPPRERTVIGISTDKACKPVNVMGMTKALQERILSHASLEVPRTRFLNVRYGNVLASRGSVIPRFLSVVRRGEPLPVTDPRMTRFLMTVDRSVDVIFAALAGGSAGETWVPQVPSGRIVDVARAVAEDADWPLQFTGMRPGEKIHETLVSEEEVSRTARDGDFLVIQPIVPELRSERSNTRGLFETEYTSEAHPLSLEEVQALLTAHGLTASSPISSPDLID